MTLKINKDLKLLRKRSEPVKEINTEIKSLISEMEETMNMENGVGFAAPQIGVLKRVVVIKDGDNKIVMINPVMLSKSKDKDIAEEGCLSIPECFLSIKRWSKLRIAFLDPDGKKTEMDLEGLLARIFQHELDHLNGILIIDKISLIEKIKNFLKK